MLKHNDFDPQSVSSTIVYCASALGERLNTLMSDRFYDSRIICVTENPETGASQENTGFAVTVSVKDRYLSYSFDISMRCRSVALLSPDDSLRETYMEYLDENFNRTEDGQWRASIPEVDENSRYAIEYLKSGSADEALILVYKLIAA